jgi:hypothetical protein
MLDEENKSKVSRITRRELNTAMISGAIGLLSSRALGSKLTPANEPIRVTTETSSIQLVHQRAWSIGSTDESTHVLGNGRAMVHELGPNIAYFRGPWISSPNLLTMTLVAPVDIRTISSREQGTTIWHHKLYVGSDSVGEIIDFLQDGEACLRRTISSKVELTWSIQGPRLVDSSRSSVEHGALVGQWPCGTDIFGDFKAIDAFAIQVVFPKRSRVEIGKTAALPEGQPGVHGNFLPHETLLHLPTGDFEMLIAAGSNVEECFSATDRSLISPHKQSLQKTRQYWCSRLANLRWQGSGRQAIVPVEPVIDDVATLLLGHQSMAGSICAGQPYPLFYVRDQYGVSRALLALNMTAEARAILAYYHRIWLSHGRIHNAQSDGRRHWFHKAENDDVEMTGYLIIQAFDYFKATKDDAFIVEILPMLEWALEVQQKQLFSDMLPFNGDETYVAGGIFPRTHLNDGSSEATLLYLAASDRILPWVTARKLWQSEKIQRHTQIAANVKLNYDKNFIVNNRLTVNRPRQPDPKVLPRFRYGVCLGNYDKNCLFLSDTEIADDGRYFCYSCYPQRTREIYQPRNYFIPSVALTSSLVGYSVASPGVMSATLSDALNVFTKNEHFAWPETRLPGYETAVVSLALSQQAHPRSAEFVQRMLELRDSNGVWAEYYTDGKPQGCRCRPWESGLSLLALLQYAAR